MRCYVIKGVELQPCQAGRTAFRSLATSSFTGQKRFKTVLLEQGLAPQTLINTISTGHYLFLIECARAYALSVYKPRKLADMREAAAGLSA